MKLYCVVTFITWVTWIEKHFSVFLNCVSSVFNLILSLVEAWGSSHQWALHADHRLITPWGAWQWATSPPDAMNHKGSCIHITCKEKLLIFEQILFFFRALIGFTFRVMNRSISKTSKSGIIKYYLAKVHNIEHSAFFFNFS